MIWFVLLYNRGKIVRSNWDSSKVENRGLCRLIVVVKEGLTVPFANVFSRFTGHMNVSVLLQGKQMEDKQNNEKQTFTLKIFYLYPG
ncbi:unnamed protein product, partial [Onchocerca flexuosa]|uniref:Uncharacterized protein n=1 Tax=Onchocerca flexuosa TaxID=387005 RepID=A0A183H090_9BILA